MKRILLSFVILQLLACFAFGSDKIAIIDVRKATMESKAGQAAAEEVQALQKNLDAKLSANYEELVKLQNDLIAQEKVLSESVKKNRRDELDNKAMAFQNSQKAFSEELARKENTLFEKIFKELEVVIKKVSDAQGYTIVISNIAVVYSKNAKDITDEVIKEYNKTYKGNK